MANRADLTVDTYQAVVSTFGEFLTVAVHTILYERDVYPRTSFLSARKYNCSVRQNRHPKVCKWIQDAVAAVEVEMLKGTVSAISIVLFSPASTPLERFVFSTTSFPRIPAAETHTPYSQPIPLIDLTSQFRAVFARLSTLSSTLSPLPPNSTFTIAIELRDEDTADPPIGHPQPWVAAEPRMQKRRGEGKQEGREKDFSGGGVKMIPVRTVGMGNFVMEMWVEEGKNKLSNGLGTTDSERD